MDHGGGHEGSGGHGGHGDMPDMPNKCSMNMLWNNQVEDTCVVFRSWHISSFTGMLFSCLVIVAISVGYASLLARMRRYERRVTSEMADHPHPTAGQPGYSAVADESGKFGVAKLPLRIRVIRAGMYASSVAVSFFLMLVAMTYNTYLCTAIVVGAFLGHFAYEGEIDLGAVLGSAGARGMPCH